MEPSRTSINDSALNIFILNGVTSILKCTNKFSF